MSFGKINKNNMPSDEKLLSSLSNCAKRGRREEIEEFLLFEIKKQRKRGNP